MTPEQKATIREALVHAYIALESAARGMADGTLADIREFGVSNALLAAECAKAALDAPEAPQPNTTAERCAAIADRLAKIHQAAYDKADAVRNEDAMTFIGGMRDGAKGVAMEIRRVYGSPEAPPSSPEGERGSGEGQTLAEAETRARNWQTAAEANRDAAMGYQDRALAAERKLAAAVRDTDRLDWLERHGNCCDQFGCGSDDYSWVVLYNDGNRAEGTTPREAIDSARTEPALQSPVPQDASGAPVVLCQAMDLELPEGVCTKPALGMYDGPDGVRRHFCAKHHAIVSDAEGHGWITGTADMDAIEGQAYRADHIVDTTDMVKPVSDGAACECPARKALATLIQELGDTECEADGCNCTNARAFSEARAVLASPCPVSALIREAQGSVCDEIKSIMQTYREQDASPFGIGTPGGLEHMGDVWRLLSKWDEKLRAWEQGATKP